MSQWAVLITQPQRALELYSDKEFPLDVRHHLSEYIESRPWMSIPPQCAQGELNALINTLDSKIAELQSTGQLELVLASHKLQQCRVQLINVYGNVPSKLVQSLSVLLQTEHEILTMEHHVMTPIGPMTPVDMTPVAMTPVAMTPVALSPVATPVTPMMEAPCRPTIANTLTSLNSWEQSANIICQYIGNTKDVLNTSSPNKRGIIQTKMKRLQGHLDKHLTTMQQARHFLRGSIHTSLETLSHENIEILQGIVEWKHTQRKSLVGFPSPVNITELELKVKQHAIQLETCLQQIRLAIRHFNNTKHVGNHSNHVDDGGYGTIRLMRNKVVSLIRELVSKSLIIEDLPTAILKKDTKFAATLRLLVGGHFGISMNLPEVSCKLVSASQIPDIISGTEDIHNTKCGEILNGNNVMEHFNSDNSVKLYLRKLMLKKYTRNSSSDKAGEERYGLCFTSKLTLHISEEDTEITMVCLSPSLALIVHTRQIALAEGSVIWDNAFCAEGEITPEEVPWGELANVLNHWFRLHTKKGLSDDNIRCLGRKLTGSDQLGAQDMVSWRSFAKDNLSDRVFSFWDWLYSAYDLIDKCLKDLWKDDLVMGFVRKEEVQRLLSICEPNTFILRFSDSLLGGISASWLHRTEGRAGEILHLEPNTHRGLSYISLAERIIGLPDLTMLYPNHPKNQVFGKYIVKRDLSSSDTAYVRQNISVTVDLPRHHSSLEAFPTLNSPLTSFDDDLPVFDVLECPEFPMSPTSTCGNELTDGYIPESDNSSFYTVNELEPSLADLDLDALLHTAQNNLQTLSSQNKENGFNPDANPDLHELFGGFT